MSTELTVAAALAAAAAGLAGFVVGALWEHLREGGTADLQRRLRTVTRLRAVADNARAYGGRT